MSEITDSQVTGELKHLDSLASLLSTDGLLPREWKTLPTCIRCMLGEEKGRHCYCYFCFFEKIAQYIVVLKDNNLQRINKSNAKFSHDRHARE